MDESLNRPAAPLLFPSLRRTAVVIALVVAGMAAPAVSAQVNRSRQPAQPAAPASRALGPAILEDRNPDPKIVEVVLYAGESEVRFGPGEPTQVYAYNQQLPGPTIEANVGDRLIVHFYNFLDEPTTVHWHGVRTPAVMDGSHISQQPVPPSGYFRYEFDLLEPGLKWYHPHVRSNVQVERGLYGALRVRDDETERELGLPEPSHLLILDDVLLDPQWQLAPITPTDPLKRTLTLFNGREGSTFLVNGQVNPNWSVERGKPVRLQLLNAANGRFMRLSIPGHQVWRIGGDGGLLEVPLPVAPIPPGVAGRGKNRDLSPFEHPGLLLTPGERADLVVVPGDLPRLAIEWHDYHRGRHTAAYDDDGKIVLGHSAHHNVKRVLTQGKVVDGRTAAGAAPTQAGAPSAGERFRPDSPLRSIPRIDVDNAERIHVTLGHTQPDASGAATFFVHGSMMKPIPFADVTPEIAPKVRVGETRVWEVRNTTGGAHNFHTHGWSFQPLEIEFVDLDQPENNRVVPFAYLENKDTVLVPQRPGSVMGRSYTIVRLAATFDDEGREGQVLAWGKEPSATRSGGWLYHCHLLEHSAAGMMSFVQVLEPR